MIKFARVNKYFGQFHVLKDINLEIKQGEVVVVIGPSGSGKSTMLRCINRLETINDGELIVDGIKVNDRKTNINELRKHVGMVFQHFNLYPHKKVIDNITLAPRKVLGISEAEAKKQPGCIWKRWGYQRKPTAILPSFPVVSSSA